MDNKEIKRRYDKALERARAGDLRGAQSTLSGVHHHKAQALRQKIESKLAAETPRNRLRIPVVAALATMLVLIVVVGILLTGRGSAPERAISTDRVEGNEVERVLPEDGHCDEAFVQSWWTHHHAMSGDFMEQARLLGMSSPGERLDNRLVQMQAIRNGIVNPPECAPETFKAAIAELVIAMDSILDIGSDYAENNNAERITMELPAARDSYRRALSNTSDEMQAF